MANNYNPHNLEPEILSFWAKNEIYKQAKENNKGKKKFYYLDGPPYTSGRVHLGTAFGKSLRDSFLRYKRMAGFDVWDRAGFDMHGLPTAHKVEAKFDIKHKDDIPKFGIKKFVQECENLAKENMDFMIKDFKRLGVWMDFDNAYTPLTTSFIEGEWWLIKKAQENNRLYEGKLAMPWCPSCATSLAKHELEYKELSEESIFLKFKIKDKENEYLIIWTTTPWTIPFNLGVMANPKLDYIKAEVDGEKWILAKGLAGGFFSAVLDKNYEILEEFKGEKLEGLEYIHPLKNDIKAYEELKQKHSKVHTVVLSKEYVDLSAGSGLVHLAPGCGPEDYEVGHKNDIPPFNNLDEFGVFPLSMGKFEGLTAKKDDKNFIEEFEKNGCLITTVQVEHDYGHCWRCKKPIIFRTTKQWFFKVEDMVPEMRELNKKIKWVPEWAGKAQFDSWLLNLRDNGITRQRYWGTPLPIWRCEKCQKTTIIGSVKELQEFSHKVPENLHRPWIDEIEWDCDCKEGKMKRIPDILDVWIDAGTTSWNCLDYPKTEDNFNKLFPPDFILEGKDQIRGWFNLLFVASMVAMKKPSFKAVYMHGFIQDSQGRKMSKSLGNIISPDEVITKYGTDTLRYYLIGAANPGLDLHYNFNDAQVKSRNLTILWNLHTYLILLSKELKKNPFEFEPKKLALEEKYMLSKLNSGIKNITELFDNYKLNETPLRVEELFLELSRTYIQLVRDKIAFGSQDEKEMVLYTIGKSLFEILKLFAPIAPFITEKIFLNLKEHYNLKKQSIHHYDWPEYNEELIDKQLEQDFSTIKDLLQTIMYGREKIQLSLRWPLKEVKIVSSEKKVKEAVEKLTKILRLQSNVKNISCVDKFDQVTEDVKLDYEKIQPEYKELTPKIIADLATRSMESVVNKIKKENQFEINVENKRVVLTKNHLLIKRELPEGWQDVEFNHGVIYLNKERNDELDAEGFAREIMRRVQSLRKKSDLIKNDKINLNINSTEKMTDYLKEWEDIIKEKVGASSITFNEKEFEHKDPVKIKGQEFAISLNKI